MKVYIEHDPPADMVRVYITQQSMFLAPGDTWEPYEPGTRPDAYTSFSYPVWDAMMKEACGSRSEDTDGIRDARATRDRLLALVESEWDRRL